MMRSLTLTMDAESNSHQESKMKIITYLMTALVMCGGAFAGVKKAPAKERKVETSKPVQPKKLEPAKGIR